MKKSMKIGLAVVMFVFATMVTVFGAEVPVNVIASGDQSVNLYVGKVEGKVGISFIDKRGYVFHSKTLKDVKSYGVQYDLHELPDGTYTLTIKQADQITNVVVEISKGKVTVNY